MFSTNIEWAMKRTHSEKERASERVSESEREYVNDFVNNMACVLYRFGVSVYVVLIERDRLECMFDLNPSDLCQFENCIIKIYGEMVLCNVPFSISHFPFYR